MPKALLLSPSYGGGASDGFARHGRQFQILNQIFPCQETQGLTHHMININGEHLVEKKKEGPYLIGNAVLVEE
jgi:hypothetical protein